MVADVTQPFNTKDIIKFDSTHMSTLGVCFVITEGTSYPFVANNIIALVTLWEGKF